MANPVDPTLIDPVTINILIVGDGRLRFDKHNYSLSTMIQALHQTAGPLVRFSTTTAYRRAKPPGVNDGGAGAELSDIRFESEDATREFDEIWLLGDHRRIASSPTTELAPEEVVVLSQFMNSGKKGGILATGDHRTLGAPLNADLPRSGLMRKWSGDLLPTNDGSPTDNNTVRTGIEGDGIPQRIVPRAYATPGSTPYPHPLLSTPGGAIDVLPDHTHEGECPELTRAMLNSEEFPIPTGFDALPLIIADSFSRSGASPRAFGAIAAYDGHLADIGRVVATSTFHHFTHENLKGFIPQPPARLASSGELGSGVGAYEQIRSFFGNLATWLAPPQKQSNMFARALWEVRWRSSVYAPLILGTEALDARRIDPDCEGSAILCLGREARAALEQLSSPSLTLLWSLEMYEELARNDSPFSFSSLYPWVLGNDRSSGGAVDRKLELVMEYLIGGAVLALASRFPYRQAKTITEGENQLVEIVREGAEAGLTAFRHSLEH